MNQENKKILIVEDDPFILNIYANQFRKSGFSVDIAIDGQMALDKIKNNLPDLLVLDINLPKIKGWDVLKIIRENPLTKNLKVIVVSNLDKKDCEAEISNLGVIKYCLKVESSPEEIAEAAKEILK